MYPRQNTPLIPSVLATQLQGLIPAEHLNTWNDLPGEQLDGFVQTILRHANEILKIVDIPLPRLTRDAIAKILPKTSNRTSNAINRAISLGLWPDSTKRLMKAPGLGVLSALDYLSALDDTFRDGIPSRYIVADDESDDGRDLLDPSEEEGKPPKVISFLAPMVYAELDCNLSTAFLTFLSRWPHRHRNIVLARHFSIGKPPTLDALGSRYGLTRERIRQIDKRCISAMKGLLSLRPALNYALDKLSRDAPSISTWEQANALVREIFPTPPGTRLPPDAGNLALLLAGFYEFDENFVYRDSKSVQCDAVWARISDFQETGLRRDEAKTATAAELRLGVDAVDALLCHYIAEHGERNVMPSIGERLQNSLSKAQEPLTVLQLLESVDGFEQRRYIENILTSRTGPFQRVGLSTFALKAWGLIEYKSINSSIRDAIQRRGGRVLLSELLDELPVRHGVSPLSVRTYASGRRFEIDSLGFVKLSGGNRTLRDHGSNRPFEYCKALFMLNERWHIRFPVNYDLLRGSGLGIPARIGPFVGLQPDSELSFNGNNQALVLRWHGEQPAISSLRSLGLSLRAKEGDYLFLELPKDRSDVAAFVVHVGSCSPDLSPVQRLALECGTNAHSDTEALFNIHAALNLPIGREPALGEIIRVLRERGDHEAIDSLPASDAAHVTSDPLEDLAELLQ